MGMEGLLFGHPVKLLIIDSHREQYLRVGFSTAATCDSLDQLTDHQLLLDKL